MNKTKNDLHEKVTSVIETNKQLEQIEFREIETYQSEFSRLFGTEVIIQKRIEELPVFDRIYTVYDITVLQSAIGIKQIGIGLDINAVKAMLDGFKFGMTLQKVREVIRGSIPVINETTPF